MEYLKFKHCGFTRNPILLALEQSDSFPSLIIRFEWQVEQIHFALSIVVVVVVIHALSNVLEHL